MKQEPIKSMAKNSIGKLSRRHRDQLSACKDKPFVVFAVNRLKFGTSLPDLTGLDVSSSVALTIPIEIVPDPNRGTGARRNIEGWDIVRKDRGQLCKTYSVESPNFDDWSKGSHEVSWDRGVYHHDLIPGFKASNKTQEIDRSSGFVTIAFELDYVFTAVTADECVLLFAINIMHESVGHSVVRATDRSQPTSRALCKLTGKFSQSVIDVGSSI